MENLIRVIETEMWDGNDLIHEWKTVRTALNSGRFDYLIENGSYKKKQLASCENVEELVELVGYPFSVRKQKTFEELNNYFLEKYKNN
jgi:hypothetical protein